MKNIKTIRKTVAIMANQLHKLGYSLSQAFKTAWRRVKKSMTCRVSGVTYENRQQLLKYIASQKEENLTVYLRRNKANWTYVNTLVNLHFLFVSFRVFILVQFSFLRLFL